MTFQSTHPRGVRQRDEKDPNDVATVSIHAPARGATRMTSLKSEPWYVFQSTHPRGVRRLLIFFPIPRQACFNPRTREGCDLSWRYTHIKEACFNPRTREGCDVKMSDAEWEEIRFNPRTREGCDAVFLPL